MLYLFRGQDIVALREAVTVLCEQVSSDPATRDMNVSRLDGVAVDVGDLAAAANTWPFMADRRLVIVSGLSRAFEGRGGEPASRQGSESSQDEDRQSEGSETPGDAGARAPAAGAGTTGSADLKARREAFASFFQTFQEQTGRDPADGGLPCDILLLEAETTEAPRRRGGRTDGLTTLATMVTQAGGRVRTFAGPKPRDLVRWIEERARSLGLALDPEAAHLLAAAIGPRTDLLDLELGKLATYADGARVSSRDVQALVAETRAANVFDLGDRVANGDRAGALALLDHLLHDGEHPMRVLQLLVRHFRLLVEARDARSIDEFARWTRLPPWPAEKTWRQAASASRGQLVAALDTLLAADAAIKQGRADPEESLLVAVLRLCDSAGRAGPAATPGYRRR